MPLHGQTAMKMLNRMSNDKAQMSNLPASPEPARLPRPCEADGREQWRAGQAQSPNEKIGFLTFRLDTNGEHVKGPKT